MEGQISEPLTFPAEDFSTSFFKKLPTDSRFLQNNYVKFTPNGSIEEDTIEFCLERYDAANIYLIQFATVKVQCVIVKENGSLPDKNTLVAPVNNILHSLFESVRLIVNDKCITSSASNYPYKAYVSNCLTYSTIAKLSQMKCEGYYEDTAKQMGPELNNTGFIERNNLFRKKFSSDEDYRPNGATFFGRILTDLVSCESGLPPNCKIKIEFDRSSDAFALMCEPTDNEKYRLKILNMCLYIPVGQLSQPVFQKISTIQAKEDVTIHFRRIEVRPFTLARGSEEYNSSNIFSDELPCRIAICFIETTAKNGNYHMNPFNFQRSWEVKKESLQDNERSDRENQLESRIKQLEQQIRTYFKKGKGRGKNSRPVDPIPGPSKRNSSSTRSIDSDLWTEDLQEETETFYIKKIDLTLNGSPIDQIDDLQSEDECMASFFRMYVNNGQMNTLYSCGITYEDFR